MPLTAWRRPVRGPASAANPTAAVQVGFVARSVALINGGDASGCGADTVCAYGASGTLWLGSAITTGACSASETVSLGSLTGCALRQCDCRFAAAFGWSADHQTLTVTIGARLAGAGYPSLGGGPWTFLPAADAARLLSGSGGIHICDNNDAGGLCRPIAP